MSILNMKSTKPPETLNVLTKDKVNALTNPGVESH